MPIEIQEVYVIRANCVERCGYIWTNRGSPSVVCACAASSIVEDEIVVGDNVDDENEFRQACADSRGVLFDEILVVKVS